jgi:ankyrin repeat protein
MNHCSNAHRGKGNSIFKEKGADVNIKAKNGFTALDVAISQGQGGAHSPEVKQMLFDAGAKE